jgi:hypothetical protein
VLRHLAENRGKPLHFPAVEALGVSKQVDEDERLLLAAAAPTTKEEMHPKALMTTDSIPVILGVRRIYIHNEEDAIDRALEVLRHCCSWRVLKSSRVDRASTRTMKVRGRRAGRGTVDGGLLFSARILESRRGASQRSSVAGHACRPSGLAAK